MKKLNRILRAVILILVSMSVLPHPAVSGLCTIITGVQNPNLYVIRNDDQVATEEMDFSFAINAIKVLKDRGLCTDGDSLLIAPTSVYSCYGSCRFDVECWFGCSCGPFGSCQ